MKQSHLKSITRSSIPFALAGLMCFTVNSSEKPNVILILTDDQGYGDVGCYGNEKLRTPHLDQMAEEGMRFTDFYMAAAVCTPSRAALLTGCYPQRVGLPTVLFPNSMPRGQKNGMALGLNPEEITIAELLQSAGYRTSCIGKWHLGDIPEFMPLNQGFDEYFGIPYSNDMKPGATHHDFDPLPLYDGKKIIEENPDQDLFTIRFTNKAIDFISRNHENPFFLYLAHPMPHRPCYVSDSLANLRFTKNQLSGIDGPDKASRDFLYPAVIEELDWSVGELLKTLKDLNIDSKTLVVFTSDNGPAVGSSGPLRGGKGSMYEGGVRVPAIMKWTGVIPTGRVCKEITASIDLYPTLAFLAGIDLPDDRVIDGVNITDYLLGKQVAEPRNTFFYLDQSRGVSAVRHKDWKLFPGEDPQLYNLRDDIGESNNLAQRYPEFVKQLTGKIDEFSEELRNNKREPGLILFKN